MSYPSIDKLQNILSDDVFANRADKKKAAGRALGTIVELITYYLFCAWGFKDDMAIERALPEFGNPDITHNVEFSFHPSLTDNQVIPFKGDAVKPSFLKSYLPQGIHLKSKPLLRQGLLSNSVNLYECENFFYMANVFLRENGSEGTVHVSKRSCKPYAMVECKRVGKEGDSKGPQTIEKAKQGAYVARTVSSLQRVWDSNGEACGIMRRGDSWSVKPYEVFVNEIMTGEDAVSLCDFMLTIGVVSNHGNWFTSGNKNKELKVLSKNYDRLLFLSDKGLVTFVTDLITSPVDELTAVRNAFLSSYASRENKKNVFTKKTITTDADRALKHYFDSHLADIVSWFNVISPDNYPMDQLRTDLLSLRNKDWRQIL